MPLTKKEEKRARNQVTELGKRKVMTEDEARAGLESVGLIRKQTSGTREKTPEQMNADLQRMSTGMLSPEARAQAAELSAAAKRSAAGAEAEGAGFGAGAQGKALAEEMLRDPNAPRGYATGGPVRPQDLEASTDMSVGGDDLAGALRPTAPMQAHIERAAKDEGSAGGDQGVMVTERGTRYRSY